MGDSINKDATVDILVVDDNNVNLVMMEKIFLSQGFTVLLAYSGMEALRILENTLPSIVLLDMKMPEMDGIEVCNRIKANERLADIPIIFISAYGNETIKVKGLLAGAVDFINKPFNKEEVILKVTNQITIRQLQLSLKEQNLKLINEIKGHKETEEKLKISEEKARINNKLLNSILNSPDGIIIFSLDTHYRYTAFTVSHIETMKHIWGVDIATGMNMLDVIKSDNDRDKAKINFDRVLKGEHFIILEDYGDDKMYRTTWENRYSPIIDKNKEVIGITVFVTDITERVKAENKVKNSEDKFATVFKNAPVLLSISKVETGEYVDVNDKFIEVSGFNKSEVIGKTSIEIGWLKSEDRKKILEEFNEKGKVNEMELHLKKKNNEEVICLFNGEIINIDGTNYLLSLARDITNRKKIEQELKINEERFRILTENSLTGVYIIENDVFSYVNPALLKMYDYQLKEVIGESPLNFALAEDHALVIENMSKRVFDNEKISQYEFRGLRKDGSILNLMVLGITIEIGTRKLLVGNILNFTELKKAEERLKLSEQKYRSIFENVQDVFYEVSVEGKILEVSPSIELVSKGQYNQSDFIGKIIYDFYADINTREVFINKIKKEGSVIDFEIELINKDGSFIPCSVSAKILFDETGNPNKIIGTMRDITERKKANSELVIAKEKAEESDRLKTSFLHNISHEVRTPMNAIIGFSQILNDPTTPDEERTYFLEIISESTKQLLAIINDIISIATLEAGQERVHLEEVNLNKDIRLVYEQFAPKTKAMNVSLRYDVPLHDKNAVIFTDNTKFVQILTNLIGNAIKFTKEGAVSFGYTVKGALVEFYVKDSGIGIPENMFDEIFQRFRQVETGDARQFGGNGLGLSISKAYVELLGGEMWLTSELGKGTTFYFTIPHNTTIIEDSIEIDTAKSLKTILIAEDDDSNFMLLEIMLKDSNYNIIRAINGIEAVEICQSNDDIVLVLMDIKMPEMNGYEATKRIKQFKPDLPIIAQTSYSNPADIKNAMESGCSDCIGKPINKITITSKIKEYLG